MLAAERRNSITEKLQRERRVVVRDLSREFGVSEETIRRDLERLDRDGIATKSYGGAVINDFSSIDLPFSVRKQANVRAKGRIAELADTLVSDGDHIILDASSTAVFIAGAIKHRKNLTVVTNSIEVLLELSDVSGWNIIASGGSLNEGHLALVGPRAAAGLSAFNVEKAFFSCKGIDLERGITEGNEQVAQTKDVIMRASQKHILAADQSKFGVVGFSKVCEVRDIDIIITDEKPDDTWLEYCKRRGIEVLYPATREPIL